MKYLPLHQSYLDIKTKYPGVLMLFHTGNFYQAIGNDAINLNKELNTILSERQISATEKTTFSGFPNHAKEEYLMKLIKAGYRVGFVDNI